MELCTLLVARALSGGRPAHNNAGRVRIPPEPAMDEISPAKKARLTRLTWVTTDKSIYRSPFEIG